MSTSLNQKEWCSVGYQRLNKGLNMFLVLRNIDIFGFCLYLKKIHF